MTAIVLRIWLTLSENSWRRLPRPVDEPVVRVSGPDPLQMLVVGSGAVVGYGVLSYQLSVGGELARLVSRQVRRGVDLDLVVGPDVSVARARAELDRRRLRGYNLILLSIGSLDAVTLLPRWRWRRDLRMLLDLVQLRGTGSRPVLLQAIPPLLGLVALPRAYRRAIDKRYRAFNATSEEMAAKRPQVTFVPFDPPEVNLVDNAGRQVHIEWAALLAPFVTRALAVTAH